MKGTLWSMAVVAVFLAVVLPAANIGYYNATSTSTVFNESGTVDYSQPVAVNNTDLTVRYLNNETVYDKNGQELIEGTDYDWNTSSGEITFYDTVSTNDGENFTIDYAYETRTDTTTDIAALISPWGAFLGIFFFVVVISALLGMLFGGGF